MNTNDKLLTIENIAKMFNISISDAVDKVKTYITNLEEQTPEFDKIRELGNNLNPLDSSEHINKILDEISIHFKDFENRISNLNLERDYNNKFYRVYKSMLYSSNFSNYMFYANLISQCRIKFTDSVDTLGVYFDNGYNLCINLKFIERYSDEVVAGLLKHEMLHILGGHLLERSKDKNFKQWNYATDCAINQLINKHHLPNNRIDEKSLSEILGYDVPTLKESEFYYELLNQAKKDFSDSSDDSDSNGNNSDGTGGSDGESQNQDKNDNSNQNERGNHKIWDKNKLQSDDLVKSVTEQMVKKALEITSKSSSGRGSIPNNISEILDFFARKSQLNWRQLLRRYQGNKKNDKRQSILKPNRRFRNRDDLRGKISNKTFTTSVIVDVSGSMSDDFIYSGLNEINTICKLTNSSLKIIQVDTEVKSVSDFDKNTRTFERSGNGGTYMYPGILKARELKSDVIILITDGYIEEVSQWEYKPKHVIFLLDNDDVKLDCNYPQFYIKTFEK